MWFEHFDIGDRPSNAEAERLRNDFDAQCHKAAKALHQADVLLLVTGAGFSADSGLAVYADVASVPAYQSRDLTYMEIFQPDWLEADPKLFYGFWGQRFNEYRETKPHAGYDISARWRDDKNLATSGRIAKTVRKRIKRKMKLRRLEAAAFGIDDAKNGGDQIASDAEGQENQGMQTAYPLATKEVAGAFFSFTSNVDAHSFDVFCAHEVMECHGNVELWQCSSPYCSSGIWRAPLNHRFVVDQETMLAPMWVHNNNPQSQSSAASSISGAEEEVNPVSPTCQCSACNTAVLLKSFSNRQRNNAMMGYGAKCPECAAASAKKRKRTMESDQTADQAPDHRSSDRTMVDVSATSKLRVDHDVELNALVFDEKTTPMKIPSSPSEAAANELADKIPHIGHVMGRGQRLNLLQYMPPNPCQKGWLSSLADSDGTRDQSSGYRTYNWVKCGHCNGDSLARPAILMFGDFGWKPDEAQRTRWVLWKEALLALCKRQARQSQKQSSSGEAFKVCIVEVGCGMNVPTCRNLAEGMVKDICGKGGDPTLVRINPDFPLSSDEIVSKHLVPIMSRGLVALQNIDCFYQSLRIQKK